MAQRHLRLFLYLIVIVIMANISPLVDHFVHPEIPYFDLEHLLVGGITAFVTALFLGSLIAYGNRMAKSANELNQVNKILKQQATRDSLTSLANHRYFQEMLRHDFLLAARHNTDLSCMMLDLDHFKKVNDCCGHPFGDTVLKGTAKQILHEARKTDTVARYGGEEFAILLPNTDLHGAITIAERIRKRSDNFIHQDDTYAMKVTISVGIASFTPHAPHSAEELLSFADQALYLAKANGRNMVLTYSDVKSQSS